MATKYSSDAMIARRKGILEATLKLLSRDDGTFTMRDLARESGVATGTLYNLFGSQDALVAEAVIEVFEQRVTGMAVPDQEDDALALYEARTEAAYKEILRVPAYAKKMVQIYFSGEPGQEIRRTLHDVPAAFARQFLDRLKADGQLNDWVSIEHLANQMPTAQYAVVERWAAEDIDDDQLLGATLYAGYVLLAGATRDKTRSRVIERLKELEQNAKRSASSAA